MQTIYAASLARGLKNTWDLRYRRRRRRENDFARLIRDAVFLAAYELPRRLPAPRSSSPHFCLSSSTLLPQMAPSGMCVCGVECLSRRPFMYARTWIGRSCARGSSRGRGTAAATARGLHEFLKVRLPSGGEGSALLFVRLAAAALHSPRVF